MVSKRATYVSATDDEAVNAFPVFDAGRRHNTRVRILARRSLRHEADHTNEENRIHSSNAIGLRRQRRGNCGKLRWCKDMSGISKAFKALKARKGGTDWLHYGWRPDPETHP